MTLYIQQRHTCTFVTTNIHNFSLFKTIDIDDVLLVCSIYSYETALSH